MAATVARNIVVLQGLVATLPDRASEAVSDALDRAIERSQAIEDQGYSPAPAVAMAAAGPAMAATAVAVAVGPAALIRSMNRRRNRSRPSRRRSPIRRRDPPASHAGSPGPPGPAGSDPAQDPAGPDRLTVRAAATLGGVTDRAALTLDIIGAGPAYSDRPGATGAAYLVRHGTTSVVLDLGQGAFTRLAATLEPSTLDAVVVSHLHPDHYIDLVPLRHYLRYEFDPPRRVAVVAPAGLDARLDGLHAQPGFAAASLDVRALAPGTVVIGGLAIEAARIVHTDDSYGFRVSIAGKEADAAPGLVYSGDCGRAEDLDPLVRPGDTLLTEVSFGPGPVEPGAMHLDGPAVGRLASRTGAGRVLLTHLQMGFDADATLAAVGAAYDGATAFAWPGDRIDLPTA